MLAAGPEIEPILLASARRESGLDARRIRAAYVLTLRDDVDVIPILASMLNDQDDRVPFLAHSMLSLATHGTKCRAAMESLLRQEDQPEGLVLALREALETWSSWSGSERTKGLRAGGEGTIADTGEEAAKSRESLMRLAEDPKAPVVQREQALRSLARYDCGSLVDRLIAVLRSDTARSGRYFEPGLAGECVEALRGSPGASVTESLAELGLGEFPEGVPWNSLYHAVRDALNERLGTRYHTVKYACRHAQRVKEAPPDK